MPKGGGIEPSLEIPEKFFTFLKSIPGSYIDKTITDTFVKYGLTREDVQLMRTRLESGYYSVEKPLLSLPLPSVIYVAPGTTIDGKPCTGVNISIMFPKGLPEIYLMT